MEKARRVVLSSAREGTVSSAAVAAAVRKIKDRRKRKKHRGTSPGEAPALRGMQ